MTERRSMTFLKYEGGQPAPVIEGVKREIRFDSSPKYVICRQFGFAEETYRQELVNRDGDKVKYNVYASADRDCPPGREPHVGVLTGFTRESLPA